jgi:hypothetical protein
MTDTTQAFHDLALKTDAQVDATCREVADSPLYNEDLAPAAMSIARCSRPTCVRSSIGTT